MTTFDFTDINKATNNLTPGMKLAVAQGLLTQAAKAFENYNKPDEATKVLGIGEELKHFRIELKTQWESKQHSS